MNYIEIDETCYFKHEWGDGKTLPNVADEKNISSKTPSKNIFFLETSCSNDGVLKLNSRQACAVESAGEKNFA